MKKKVRVPLLSCFKTTTSVQLHAKYVTLTTEMYLKYKAEEEISPHNYGEV